jgi:hypothetical protein
MIDALTKVTEHSAYHREPLQSSTKMIKLRQQKSQHLQLSDEVLRSHIDPETHHLRQICSTCKIENMNVIENVVAIKLYGRNGHQHCGDLTV